MTAEKGCVKCGALPVVWMQREPADREPGDEGEAPSILRWRGYCSACRPPTFTTEPPP